MDKVPNVIAARPMFKNFPIKLCNLKVHAKVLLLTEKLTEYGKSEITSELISTMKKFERYFHLEFILLLYSVCNVHFLRFYSFDVLKHA